MTKTVYVYELNRNNVSFSIMSKDEFEIRYGLEMTYDEWKNGGELFDDVIDFDDVDQARSFAKQCLDRDGYYFDDFSEEDYEEIIDKIAASSDSSATEKMLMNPATGSVATESEWREDFACMSNEEWGGETFEDAELIEVVKNDPEKPGYDLNFGEWRDA